MNPYLIKVEKIPAAPENWMGIQDFREPMEYVFFCIVLMFLEDKETDTRSRVADGIYSEPVQDGAD